ncbi:hypothetical protein FOA52_010802 [Chlamydomonas sp. UWO 241]|nr:hypothetical protein FOA52_010802 [Chlamydomonas sp. UWO 241]
MFYSYEILGKRGPLGAVWSMAHGKRLSKQKLLQIHLTEICSQVLAPDVPHSLRLQGILIGGIALVFAKQQAYFLEDLTEMVRHVKDVASAAGAGQQGAGEGATLKRGKQRARAGDITVNADDLLNAAGDGGLPDMDDAMAIPGDEAWDLPGDDMFNDLLLVPTLPGEDSLGRSLSHHATPRDPSDLHNGALSSGAPRQRRRASSPGPKGPGGSAPSTGSGPDSPTASGGHRVASPPLAGSGGGALGGYVPQARGPSLLRRSASTGAHDAHEDEMFAPVGDDMMDFMAGSPDQGMQPEGEDGDHPMGSGEHPRSGTRTASGESGHRSPHDQVNNLAGEPQPEEAEQGGEDDLDVEAIPKAKKGKKEAKTKAATKAKRKGTKPAVVDTLDGIAIRTNIYREWMFNTGSLVKPHGAAAAARAPRRAQPPHGASLAELLAFHAAGGKLHPALAALCDKVRSGGGGSGGAAEQESQEERGPAKKRARRGAKSDEEEEETEEKERDEQQFGDVDYDAPLAEEFADADADVPQPYTDDEEVEVERGTEILVTSSAALLGPGLGDENAPPLIEL